MNRIQALQRALRIAARENPTATADELAEAADDLMMEWEREAAEQGTPEDSPSLESCDRWGTGEGRYHGVI